MRTRVSRFAVIGAISVVVALLLSQSLQSQIRRGDRDRQRASVPPVAVAEDISPAVIRTYRSADGLELPIAYRMPPGDGPFPAVLFFHGGVGGFVPGQDEEKLRSYDGVLMSGSVQTRFLKAGYVVAASTRRNNSNYRRRAELYAAAIQDCAAAVRALKALPRVDSQSVCIYGGSYGGILAISTTTVEPVAAVVAGEPASVEYFFIGLRTPPENKRSLFDDMTTLLSAENKEKVKKVTDLSKVSCPSMMMHGNTKSGIYKVNSQYVIKELKSHDKFVVNRQFTNLRHGFYWGRLSTGVTQEIVETMVTESDEFFRKYVKIKPKSLDG